MLFSMQLRDSPAKNMSSLTTYQMSWIGEMVVWLSTFFPNSSTRLNPVKHADQ